MKKKVLLVASVQSHICQFHKILVKELHENGYEVHVAARNNLAEKNGLKLDFVDKVFDVPFARSPLNIKAIIKSSKELNDILKNYTYDVIHCNTPVAGVVTRLVAKKYRKHGTRVFYTAHGFHFYKGAPLINWIIYYPIEKIMSKFTDVLITITNEDFNIANNSFACKVVRMHGVGANSERFFCIDEKTCKCLKKQFNISAYPIIINVGELLPNKNQKTIISAMPNILKVFPKAKLYIAGNGPEKDKLNNLIKEYGLIDHVELLGYTTEVHKYLKMSDILVSCSYREGMPLNVIEAMLCGKPVVASNNRGHRELIIEGVNGFLFKPNDSEELSEKIIDALRLLNGKSAEIERSVDKYKDSQVLKELRSIYNI